MIWLLLGCPYIPADEHAARVAGLLGPVDPQVDVVEGGLLAVCPEDTGVKVRGTVAADWAARDLEVRVALDAGAFFDVGAVRTAEASNGRAPFELDVPVVLLEVPECDRSVCVHDLALSLRDGAHEGTTVASGAVQKVGEEPWVGTAYVRGDAVAELADAERRVDPADALLTDEWPWLGIALDDPWLAAGGDPAAYTVQLASCPRDVGFDVEKCTVVDAAPSLVTFGADGGWEAPTEPFATATCGEAGVEPAGEWFARVVYAGCGDAWLFSLPDGVPLRFVTNDCDGDGIYGSDGDCADADPLVNPNATEVACNGVDENCTGGDTDGPESTPGWVDLDLDGYGAGPPNTRVCGELPTGYVGKGDDCDDSDPARFPNAIDPLSDGIDQDCDGSDG